MRAYVFPGQGSQFTEMGKEEFSSKDEAKRLFARADEVIGFKLSDVMFNGTAEDLKSTRITQPAIYVHSYVRAKLLSDALKPGAVAGHSLGEFTALTVAGAIDFDRGLELVHQRALAMQEACEQNPGTMAAIVGLEDEKIEEICSGIDGIVVPANYNCPGQLVISGEVSAVEKAIEALTAAGAKRALLLEVGGAFHSPLMAPAREKLREAIEGTSFSEPVCPVYQNVDAKPSRNPGEIQRKLVEQLTEPVRWTQTMQNMIQNGMAECIEVGGRGGILSGLLRRIDRNIDARSV